MKRFLASIGLTVLVGCSSFGPSRGATEAIENGGEWFLNNQDENFIYYQYEPETDQHPNTHHSAREMGALWSITKLWKFLEDDRYEALALRGWDYFSATIQHDEAGNFSYFTTTPEKIKLSYNAFGILSLLELDVPDKEATLEQLANGILYQQEESGEFKTFFFSDRSSGKDYYPGQALLALMSLYETNGNEAYLAAVEKAFPFYYDYFDENPNTAFVPWQTQAYYKYYQVKPSEEVANYIFGMNDYIVNSFSDGAYCKQFDFSLGVVTAVYIEGINKAYSLAEEVGDTERSECYEHFIQEGSTAIMALQFPMKGQKANNYADAALGGFSGSSADFSHQVDRNQHAVMALMGAYELGLIK